MKNTLVAVVGLILTATSVLMFRYDPVVMRELSQAAYDVLLRHTHQDAVSDAVVIVDLDETSLRELGQWPWPRYRVADLTDRLFEAGAEVVLFDILFVEPDGKSPSDLIPDINQRFNTTVRMEGLPEEAADFDQRFADSLGRGKTVLGCFLQQTGSPADRHPLSSGSVVHARALPGTGSGPEDLTKRLTSATSVESPLPVLGNAAASVGFINADVDDDNVARSSRLFGLYGKDRLVPSLALEALRLYLDVDQAMVEYDRTGIRGVRLRERVIPTDPFGRTLINYRSLHGTPARSVPYLSAADVLNRTVDPAALAGKIVFVGTSATGLRDLKATPLTSGFAGVETHANLVENVLAGEVLRSPPGMQTAELLGLVLVGVFLTVVIHRGRPWLAMSITAAGIMATTATTYLLMSRYHLVFVPARLLVSVTVIYLVLTSIRYWQEESNRKRLRGMFGSMVSEKVLAYLEAHPESFSLEGRDVEATVFFSDLAGFTSIAESLNAGEVSRLLNEYLSAMNRIILDRGGYLDKYNGDGIMAVWGVPTSQPDHAAQACLAALEQAVEIRALRDRLQEQYGYEVQVRMGLNSGVVKAGNMGSKERMQYTVIGDVVNQAARLEPLNKLYGTHILIGEQTRRQAGDAIETRLIDQVIVKGKSKAIAVHEVLAPGGGLTTVQQALVLHYEQALACYRERRWDDALNALANVFEQVPEDGPSQVLRQRIEQYQAAEPSPAWDGSFAYAGG